MKPLSEIKPNEEAIIDCIDIEDETYHRRLNALGLKCKDKIKCINKSYGMYHLAVGISYNTEFALRQSTCDKITIR